MCKQQITSDKTVKLSNGIDKDLKGAYAFGHKSEEERQETRDLMKQFLKNRKQ